MTSREPEPELELARPGGGASQRRPANDPGVLASQLQRELSRLESAEGKDDAVVREATRLARAYLGHAQALAWRDVARGELGAPRRVLDALVEQQSFIDEHLPEPGTTSALARLACELQYTLLSLYTADEALEEERAAARIHEDLPNTERAVLKALFENPGTYLRRTQVYKRLPAEDRPSLTRVGQVLMSLYHDGFLLRLLAPAQGNPRTAHYQLSARGTARSREVFLESQEPGSAMAHLPKRDAVPDPKKEHPVEQQVEAALRRIAEPATPELERSVLTQSLANSGSSHGGIVIAQLRRILSTGSQNRVVQAARRVLQLALLSRYLQGRVSQPKTTRARTTAPPKTTIDAAVEEVLRLRDTQPLGSKYRQAADMTVGELLMREEDAFRTQTGHSQLSGQSTELANNHV